MEKKYLLLGMGLLSLISAYALFDGDQYFSAIHMLLLMVLVFVSVALLMLAYLIDEKRDGKGRDYKMLIGIALSLASTIIIIVEAEFAVFSEPIFLEEMGFMAAVLFLAALTAATSYAISIISANKKGAKVYLLIGVCIIVCSILIGELGFFTLFGSTPPRGTDELTLNYYAAKSFLAGHSPYATDFSADLQQEAVWPTFYLNGTCQCRYIYPPLAFISLVPFALSTTYQNFLPIDLIGSVAIFIAVLVVLYRSSRNNVLMLLPAFSLSLVLYLLEPWVISIHIAMALLLLAYVLRKRAFAYPILIGIAASVHELIWLALPFLLITVMREEGSKRALRFAAIVLLVFLAINSYFLLTSESDVVNDLLNFHPEWVQPFGINVVQFFRSFYPIEYGSLTLFFLLSYALVLLIFFINKRNDALMCLASTIIFVFSSTSRMPYTTLFMPLLIYLIIKKDASGGVEESRHMHNSLLYSLIGVVAFAFLFLIMAVNSHQEYTSLSPPILFGTVSFNLTNTTSGMQTLDSIILQLGSRLPNETIGTLLVASRDPNALKDIFLVNFDGNGTHPVYTYFEIPLQLDNVTASTQLKLFVSGDHYMTYREIQVQNKST